MKIPLSFIIKIKIVTFLLVGSHCSAQIPGEWLSPVRISNLNNTTAALTPKITLTQTGKIAISIWKQDDDGGTRRIYGSRFDGTTWTDFASPISGSAHTGTATLPRFSIDDSGNAIAIWKQDDGTGVNRVYSAYFNGSTWSLFADPISGTSHTESIDDPCISSTDQNGNAIAIWKQDDGTGIDRVYSARFNGSTWALFADPVSGTTHTQDATLPDIGFNADGKGFAVWQQPLVSVGRIYSAYFNGSSWSVFADPISGTSHTRVAARPQVATDATGNAVAVWQQLDEETGPLKERMYSARFNGSTWSLFADPVSGTSHTDDAERVRVAVSNTGVALAIWNQFQASNVYAAGALFNGSSWSLFPDPLSNTVPSLNLTGRVVINKNNNTGIAVWRRRDEANVIRLYGASYDGTDWTKFDTPISGTTHTGNVSSPEFCCIDDIGNTMVVWEQVTPTAANKKQSYAAFFQVLLTAPQINGFQISQRYPTQTDLINIIQWTKPTSANPIVQYNIYCDGLLLRSVDTQEPLQSCHHNRCENQKLTYTVTAVDSAGNESAASNTITIG